MPAAAPPGTDNSATSPWPPPMSARDRDILGPLLDAPAGQPCVVAQLGQSLDGRIATVSGESRWINGEAALDHLHRLRACVDAVVVGIGTALADDPILNVRRVAGRHPARVVIDPRGRLPAEARCLAEDGARRLVIHAGRAARSSELPGVEMVACPPGAGGRIDPNTVVAALHARGLSRILVEGGAWTVSSFIEAGAVDRLHMLVAPVILGSGKPGLSLAPIERLGDALRPSARVHVLGDTDVLFDCDLRAPRPA